MAVTEDTNEMIETPWGKKRWSYLKHTMQLEQWLLDHVPEFSNAVMRDLCKNASLDLDTSGATTDELDQIAEKFSEDHEHLATWFHELYTAVFTDPEKYEGRLN